MTYPGPGPGSTQWMGPPSGETQRGKQATGRDRSGADPKQAVFLEYPTEVRYVGWSKDLTMACFRPTFVCPATT